MSSMASGRNLGLRDEGGRVVWHQADLAPLQRHLARAVRQCLSKIGVSVLRSEAAGLQFRGLQRGK